jgi:hypothetical protein
LKSPLLTLHRCSGITSGANTRLKSDRPGCASGDARRAVTFPASMTVETRIELAPAARRAKDDHDDAHPFAPLHGICRCRDRFREIEKKPRLLGDLRKYGD